MRVVAGMVWMVLLLAGCTSNSAPESTDTNVVSEEGMIASGQDPAKSEIICKKERVVGSAIPQKICRTRAQMAAQEEEARRTMNQIRGGANAVNPAP